MGELGMNKRRVGPHPSARLDTAGAPRPRILLVEDDVEQREAIAELLETAGYVVERAVDGPDALEIARRSRPDIILMDISMPRMDGFEVANRLRIDRRTHSIPLVAMTARNISAVVVRARGDFDDVFFKPIVGSALLELLAELLAQRNGKEC